MGTDSIEEYPIFYCILQDKATELDAVVIPEYQFCSSRKWKIDFFVSFNVTGKKVGIEVQGGVLPYYQWVTDKKTQKKKQILVTRGGHAGIDKMVRDIAKQRAMARAGILFVPVIPTEISDEVKCELWVAKNVQE